MDMHEQEMKIVIIILTLNQRDKTLNCLSHLLTDMESNCEVLIWDNGSIDGTIEAVRNIYPQVYTYRSSTNLGVAEGRNAAAKLAIDEHRASHLLFLDNDIFVEPNFVKALHNSFQEDPRLGQTQAKLRFMHDRQRLNDGGGARINFILWRIRPVGYGEIDRGQYDTPVECISCGGAMMVRTEIFNELGGFDPIFGPFGPEDLDFSLRLRKAGYRAMYIPQAVGYHQVSHTYGKGYSEDYARHKSRHWLTFMRRHAKVWEKLIFYLIGAPFLALHVTLREVKQGNWQAVRGLLRGILGS
jgi:GT2 family glycosyltransferase